VVTLTTFGGRGLDGQAAPGPTVVEGARVVTVGPAPATVDDVVAAGAVVDVEVATVAVGELPPPHAAMASANNPRERRMARSARSSLWLLAPAGTVVLPPTVAPSGRRPA